MKNIDRGNDQIVVSPRKAGGLPQTELSYGSSSLRFQPSVIARNIVTKQYRFLKYKRGFLAPPEMTTYAELPLNIFL